MAVKLDTKNSVVDLMKSKGMDSSFDARKELATNYGIKNYSGSYDQNIKLHSLISKDNQKEVSLYDNTGSTPKADTGKKDTGKKDTDTKGEVLDASVPSAGVSQDVWNAMNTTFTAPSAYDEAMSLTMSKLEQITSGRTSYTDQIKALMEQIQNRDDFSYDVSQDTLFQQSLASAMASGKTAMQDTIGQASALTGGYGSTYATSAGNQAYNAYIQDAYANLPEYYQMALEAYQMEGQEMYDQLAMLNSADATEYQRNYDAWSANFANAQNIYNQAYGEWQDSINNAYNMGNLQLSEQRLSLDQENTSWSQKYQEEQARLDNEYRNKALEQDNTHFYDNLNAEEKQFVARYDVNGDGVVDSKDQVSVGSSSGSGESGATRTQMGTYKQKALELQNEKGNDAVDAYIDSLGLTEDEMEEIARYLYGDGETSGYAELPLEQRTFTKVENTVNGFLGVGNLWGSVDDNDIVQDQYGNSYRIDELPEALRKSLSKLKKGESYTA